MTLSGDADHPVPAPMRLVRIGLHSQGEPLALMRTDCHVCRSEGLHARARVEIASAGRRVTARLLQVEAGLLNPHEIGLSEDAWARLGATEGAEATVRPAPVADSMSLVRRKLYGGRLDQPDFAAILDDVQAGLLSDVELAAFLSAGAALPLDDDEATALTRAMVAVGDRLSWGAPRVMDKHCVGGLPGNRTTPIVVAIVAACGLVIPKTSSRAITSPAGTADTMETLAPVDLDLPAIRRVVEAEGGCVVWGGAVRLSPADDAFVRIERELDIDAEGQLIASVLSKKVAAGSTHVVIDIPVGPTAKVRTPEAARSLAARLSLVGGRLGLNVACLLTDGSQPVGRGIGPAPEARDVLAVLQGGPNAPQDLALRAIALAAVLLETGGAAKPGSGAVLARAVLADGRAWAKFAAICEAQGGLREPPEAAQTIEVTAYAAGTVAAIDNRRLARLAKLAGAPANPAAGLTLAVSVGDAVTAGQPLFRLHAASAGEIAYAIDYWTGAPAITVGG
ncbi:thymidine phosphorylase family protein [Tabrizicola fusiformis]|uniref:thymidine phosphorylase family protein n=1 Tax=Tabrizicola sp. SY72 TaxID=2741673 RepID=UPI00321FC916